MRETRKEIEVKTYDVYMVFTFTRHMQVEAESEDEAEDIAIGKKGVVTVCHNCSSKVESDIELQSTSVEEARDPK